MYNLFVRGDAEVENITCKTIHNRGKIKLYLFY